MTDRHDTTEPYLLEAVDIVKRYGNFLANDRVNLQLRPGKIHALLGENGAGKSTLVKIMYGALQPTTGTLRWCGRSVSITNPATARRLGISMVFQHFSLFDALSVVENVALTLAGRFSPDMLAQRISALSREYGLPIEPKAIVADLSVGERQRIEILRCLLQKPQLLIMDEPTSVLTPQESEQLFMTLQRLAKDGCAVLYISHRLEEVQRLCQAATILRRGRVVANVDPQEETVSSLARLMVGEEIHTVRTDSPTQNGRLELAVNELSLPKAGPFGVTLHGISLGVRSGQVMAIAGIAGNGQSELFEALSGERLSPSDDMIMITGLPSGKSSVIKRRRLGAAFVPEERLGHSAVPDMELSDNVLLTRHASDSHLVRGGFIDHSETVSVTERVTSRFDVRINGVNPQAAALSGGNLQKFVVGRELDREPSILVINQPTWGVDAGAAALIRQALSDMANSGAAVLVISQDLDEIFEIADHIAVISRGKLSTTYPATRIDRKKVGLLMAGVDASPPTEDGSTA